MADEEKIKVKEEAKEDPNHAKEVKDAKVKVEVKQEGGGDKKDDGKVLFSASQFTDVCGRLYEKWKAEKDTDAWGPKADVIAIACDSDSKDVIKFPKAQSLITAMFSLELHDILTVLCPKKIIFLAASKKARVLQALADDLPSKFPTKVEVRVRDKSDKDKANFQYILGEMKEERSETKVGTLLKEKYDGSFAQEWNSFLGEASGISKVDITNGLTDFLAIKSDKQVEAARQAGTINTAAFKSCLNKILDVVDSNEKFMLTKISEHVENELPKTIAPLQLPVDVEDVEVVIPPNVQSGTYDLKYSALTEESPLNLPDKGVPAIYISSVSLRVKSCFGMLARTLLFNVKPEQEANYRLLLEVVEKCQGLLKPGTRMNKVYEAASDLLKSKKPSLLGNLTKELGWSLGYELREKRFVFDEKNRSTLKVGMLVCLRIGLENLSIQSKDPKSSKYSMLLADTFLITKDGAECLTNAPKKHSKVSWNVSDDGDEEKKSDNKKSVQDELDRKLKELEKQKLSHKLSEEEKEQARKDFEERNNQLALQRVEEQRRRRYNESSGSDDKRERSQTSGYLGTEDFPSRAWSNKGYLQLYIDEAAQTILVPINGLPVPFHISTVKNASIQSQGIAGNVLRINFVSPGAGVSIGVNKDAIYLRELSYRAQESQNLILVHQQIMAMKKTYQQEERERKARDELVPQEPLRLNPNRGPRLQNLRIYPNIQARGRKTEGDLEAHVNGFRFAVKKAPSPDLKHIDILYRNIKHAFFQPSNKHSNLILLHFRLKNAIMIGKQSTRDIQFFLEWLEDGESLMENKRKNPYDRDEIEDEQRQKEMVSKLDREFKKFCDKVQELLPPYDPSNPGGDKIWDWDIPYVELEFQGNPKNSMVELYPSLHCLVHLATKPVFIVDLDEVDLAYYERLRPGNNNFDLTFIYKRFLDKDVKLSDCWERISNIDVRHYDTVKEVLQKSQLVQFEGPQQIAWNNVLKDYVKNFDDISADGGWKCIFTGSDDEDEEGDEADEDDGDFEMSGSESEYEDSEEESEEYSENSEESESEEEELSDEGMDSDEAERWAEEEDKKAREARNAKDAAKMAKPDKSDKSDKKRKPEPSSSDKKNKKAKR